MKPEQMAATMERMPAPKTDEKKGDPKETAQLAFSDKWLDGKGFTRGRATAIPLLEK
jgi:hypothetical protein